MARMPIEIVLIEDGEEPAVSAALALANSLQTEFDYTQLLQKFRPSDQAAALRIWL